MITVHLLATAGVLYGLREIAGPALMRWTGWRWLGGLVGCSYCTGFHAGWVGWLMITFAPPVVVYAFAGAALGLLIDRLQR